MTLKSRLNTVVILSIATVVTLFGFLFYTTWQIDDELDQIAQVNKFSETASELNMISEQYLAYQEPRYYKKWVMLYQNLQETKERVANFPSRKVVTNALPSIKRAFSLIQEIYESPELYPDSEKRDRLLERATVRIRSDIQLLLSASHRLEQARMEQVRDFQVYQRIQVLLILVPGIGFVIYMIFRVRKQILNSLKKLLEGTKSIAGGNLEKTIALDGFEEHNKLATAFNEMTDELQNHIKREQELRKKAEENLELWEVLVQQAPSLVIIHQEGEIQFINESGVEILGADSKEDVLATKVYDYFVESEKQKAAERIKRLEQKQEQVEPAVYQLHALDGETRYLQIQSVPTVYEGENATQSVGLDITEHIRYEEQLQASLEEKSVLLQEIHHRVKNNLAIISGMMQLQAMEAHSKRLTNELNDSQLRIQSMALIHELLYDTESFTNLKFAEQIKRLVSTIAETLQTGQEVEVNCELEDVTLNVNQAIPCALILNELVTNAFKHAFENGGGRLDIVMETTADKLKLTVSDNGIGLPGEFSIDEASTLGMRIVQTLCQQLEATINYQRDDGSRFEIRFPMADVKGVGSAHMV